MSSWRLAFIRQMDIFCQSGDKATGKIFWKKQLTFKRENWTFKNEFFIRCKNVRRQPSIGEKVK
jgi:hypothetical protein